MESAAVVLSLWLLAAASSQQISDISVKLGPEELTVVTRLEDRAVGAGKIEGNITEPAGPDDNRQMPRNAKWGKNFLKNMSTGDEKRNILFHNIYYPTSILLYPVMPYRLPSNFNFWLKLNDLGPNFSHLQSPRPGPPCTCGEGRYVPPHMTKKLQNKVNCFGDEFSATL